jgi:hypothetical protein
VRLCEEAICEFTIPVLRDAERRLEYDFSETQLALWLSQFSFDQDLKSEELHLRQVGQSVKRRDVAAGNGCRQEMLRSPIAGITLEFGGSRELDRGRDYFRRDFAF